MYVYLTTEIKGLQVTVDKKYRIIENDGEYFKIQADDKPRWFKWGTYPWNVYEPNPLYQTPELVNLLDEIKQYQDLEPFLNDFENECYRGLLVKLNEYLQKVR